MFQDEPLDDLEIDFDVCSAAVSDSCCGRFNVTTVDGELENDGFSSHFPKCEVTFEGTETVLIREKETFKKHDFDLDFDKKKKELPPRAEANVTTIETDEWVLVKKDKKTEAETWKFVGAAFFCVCPVS